MVQAEAGAYLSNGTDRVLLSGPDILLEPQAFTTVALVIHEMITNSAKYGALSDTRGRVRITSSIDPLGQLVIDWNEQGGPPVKPPARRGFGSTVIERSIQHDLKGKVTLDFALAGLSARFVIPPAQFTVAEADVTSSANPVGQGPGDEAGKLPQDVLLVEDSMIIALDAEDMMHELGVATVRVTPGVRDALQKISERAPDFALLDVNLGDETSFELAERLRELRIPFVFATGYGEQLAYPEAFVATPKLRKPYTIHSLQKALLNGGS
jgi:CheY-like chemotaxis protein